MDNSPPEISASPAQGIGIAAVERDTGLGKDTLRVWERRYGFPQPLRDVFGERVYLAELLHLHSLLRQGYLHEVLAFR